MKPATSFIYAPPNWLDPLDWMSVFGNQHSVEIEIGCGKGAFLMWSAQARPDTDFLGVERQIGRLRSVERKARQLGLTNVRLVRIEASYLVAKLVPADSVSAYHIFFPDPWPKRRHQRRRLFSSDFVTDMVRTLQIGGYVNVATDSEDYYVWIRDVMGGGGSFREEPATLFPAAARTEFERVFLAAAKPVLRSRWTKQSKTEAAKI